MGKVVVHSIYFGGGTPSLIPSTAYEQILKTLDDQFELTPDCEISLEANPGTITEVYLNDLFSLGINRLSLGVQSTDSFDLVRLDRIHTLDDVLDGVYHARRAGFTNLNLDLIFGLPWQSLVSWKHSLSRAVSLQPEHFSLYSLIIEPGTALDAWYKKGLIAQQDQDLEADMYEFAMNMLNEAGYRQYEISNWAKTSSGRDLRSRHNLQYWLNQPYFGFGAAAHGYVGNKRTANTPLIEDYIHRITDRNTNDQDSGHFPAAISLSEVDKATQMKDFMMLGLRLVEDGVSQIDFMDRYGRELETEFQVEITQLLKQGLIEWVTDSRERLRLTKRGVFLANQVFMQFV
jgi:oxygen-independent coproporphyrinogen-3 oxidase